MRVAADLLALAIAVGGGIQGVRLWLQHKRQPAANVFVGAALALGLLLYLRPYLL